MTRAYPHLGLVRWPFPVVPEPAYCTFLAARSQLRSDVRDIVTSLARRDTSSIHLFWAWFGAGKTHTLHYLCHRASTACRADGSNLLHSVYTEFPKGARTFLDVYRSLVVALDLDLLTEAFLEVWTSPQLSDIRRRMNQASPDLFNALQVLATGQAQAQVLAQRWLRVDPVPLGELRRVGIGQRISTSDEATRILASVVALLNLAAQSGGRPAARLIWILDEFQRIERAGRRGIEDINSGLHSTFNACPNSLSLIFSFSGKPQAKGLPDWFSLELRDRLGGTKVMVLPPMSPDEALCFVREIFAELRPTPGGFQPYFPFSEAACKVVIGEVQARGELKPRALMHAFNAVLQEAEPLIEQGKLDVIGPEFTRTALKEYVLIAASDEHGGDT